MTTWQGWKPESSTSGDRLVDVVAQLAGEEFAGRRVGSSGGRAAGRWLAERLRASGARVARDEFTATGVRDLYATPELEWSGRPGLVHRRDFAEHLRSADQPTPVTGPLTGADAPDWRDRWVLVTGLSPEVTARAGAERPAGLLVPRGVDEAGWMPKMIAGPAPLAVAVLSVRTDLHAAMTAAADEDRQVRATVPLRTVAVTGGNVHGVFAEPAHGGRSVLLCAHYDGVGDDPAVRLPAAADNASGVAVVIEAARQLAAIVPAGTGLAVALLDAEEAGARGSAHHAPQVPAGTYVINVDGAAALGHAAAVEAGGPAEALLAALDQAGRHTGVPLAAGAMASDNRRYAAAGLPAVGVGMGMPGYQTPAETSDRVQATTLLAATRLVVATVATVTGGTVPVGLTALRR